MEPLSVEFASFLLLGGAAVATYAASRGAVDALLSEHDPAPVKRALIHSAITAVISLAAIVHRPALLDIAVGVPFSASIGAIALTLGVVVFVAHLPDRALDDPVSHRAWAFVLPTGLLTLLIGFGGSLTPRSALMLSAQGAVILIVAVGRRSKPVLPPDGGEHDAERHSRVAVAQAVFALALAIVAGWAMVQGAAGLALHNPAFRPGVAAVLALGPAVVLPMIPPLATLAERGRRDEAITAIVAFALINLCVVLPMVIIAWQLIQKTDATPQPFTVDLPFPILVWRLDTVLLSTIGLLLLPMAIGRWALSRAEGVALVGLYVMYLFLTLLISHG